MNEQRSLLSVAALFVRLALAASFLSALADRFGLWGDIGTGEVAWGNFENFVTYTGILLWYLPENLVLISAWLATALELILAVGLIFNVATRYVAGFSSALLLLFAISMTIATGREGPLSYSVWTASAAALLLASLPPSKLSE